VGGAPTAAGGGIARSGASGGGAANGAPLGGGAAAKGTALNGIIGAGAGGPALAASVGAARFGLMVAPGLLASKDAASALARPDVMAGSLGIAM